MDLCIALDMPDWESNTNLVKDLREIDNLWYKVGIRSVLSGDIKSLLRSIRLANSTSRIFLDLNLFDIPYNMSHAVDQALSLNIDMLSVNIHSGISSLTAASNATYAFKPKITNRPKIIASTILTSMTEGTCVSIYDDSIRRTSIKLAELAQNASMQGICCPPTEAKSIRAQAEITPEFLVICSGIRSSLVDGHVQYTDLFDAYYSKVNMVVIGRPIYARKTPFTEVVMILDKISKFGGKHDVPF